MLWAPRRAKASWPCVWKDLHAGTPGGGGRAVREWTRTYREAPPSPLHRVSQGWVKWVCVRVGVGVGVGPWHEYCGSGVASYYVQVIQLGCGHHRPVGQASGTVGHGVHRAGEGACGEQRSVGCNNKELEKSTFGTHSPWQGTCAMHSAGQRATAH
jgi:hypothetical protein